MSDKPARLPQGLLDTNILIHWSRLSPDQLPLSTAISAVTLAELAAAIHADLTLNERAKRLDVLQRAESIFDPLPFDAPAARAYGRVTAAVRAAGRSPRARVADQMIAAVAASHDLPLFTTNAADFLGLERIITVVAVERPK
ncbi:type II toxin-antitoxin system VapC family toxin [Propionimicrobium sp. PCR01-08-3]|uniref:type II toxin-antitoxin system VapC family toxin n=1 Tax=Propionimicrobium sp. PCR01-08-3 TaxID=3052086 RepID=UPI00255C4F3F|nr:type II toxin-antitoxin system VapC family toxin [Propionimicrobium sp. PCR01-08-3]WIY81601.1 type II toxin-antitoxin system VapC family toxin [Propionimicrobium sp. PCR01-08-3]